MKRGTTPTLTIKIDKDRNLISSICFLFKQDCSESCTTKLKKDFPSSSVTYDATNKVYNITFTDSETRTFRADDHFYLDTRITLTNGMIPETKIIILKMNNTLFSTTDTVAEEESDD